jgi:hypothetical protein
MVSFSSGIRAFEIKRLMFSKASPEEFTNVGGRPALAEFDFM